jgi:hypothetical protein
MRYLQLILLTIFICSCNSQKSKNTINQENENSAVDTVITIDSDSNTNSMILPDTLFMNFFDMFMWDKEFQKSRIVFPFKQDDKTISNSDNWKHLPFYADSSYMPILFSDTLNNYSERVETKNLELFIVNFETKKTTKYDFKKSEKKWFLVSSGNFAINNVPDFEFIDFLIMFSNDSIFQINHTLFPLPESYVDPEKDYEMVVTSISLNDWEHIEFVNFINRLVILSYIDIKNKYRNIFLRGIENGIWVQYVFEKIDGNWILIELKDYST